MSLAALGWNETRQLDFANSAAEGLVPGRIVGEHRTHYRVAIADGEIDAGVTGRLRQAAASRADLPGTGDFVALRPGNGADKAVIEAVLPRSSALIRKASGETRPQLLAANVDVVFIVIALDGDFNLARLARYLALVHASGARPVVIANKVDLSDDPMARVAEIGNAAPGVPVHAISARATDAIAVLAPYFDGDRTIAFVGSSGVGKSTLTNRLLGNAVQAIQEVRAHDNRGRHTTTHRHLFVRPQGGAIMDTPGMRGLELWTSESTIAPDFSDIEALAGRCKFRNCRHGTEPSCAVRAAIDAGELDPERLVRFAAQVEKGRRVW